MSPGARTVAVAALVHACASHAHPAQPQERSMSHHAKGSFDVTLAPQEPLDKEVNRIRFDKQFHGDLVGTSHGEMFPSETGVKGSAGYVGRERITGTLHGKQGSFIVQHLGTMGGGAFALRIEIVPDSGTDQLVGLTGSLKIIIEPGGKHFYEIDYELANRGS